jgi:hypothetical protein
VIKQSATLSVLDQFALQFQAVYPRHGNIEYQAAGTRRFISSQKSTAELNANTLEHHFHQSRQRPQNCRIIVDQKNRGVLEFMLFLPSRNQQGKNECHSPLIILRHQASAMGIHDRSAN